LSQSIFETRKLNDVYEEIRKVYLSDNRPWIIGFSGGKDSTCLVQLVWNALSTLSPEKLQKQVYVISSDTLVESPQIAARITESLDKMEKHGQEQNLPISTNLLRPKISDTFWVRLLGLGYPAPTVMFRWCTDMLKINNADRFIEDKVSQYGEAIVLLGMRKSESISRHQTMNLYKIDNSLLSRHSKYAQTYIYTPIEDFSAEDVWNYLLQNKNPWNENNRDLLALYQDANASECPLVVDTSTPSCGGGRFGCWTCTVVEKQSYLTNLIENGEEWMEVLAELREELKITQISPYKSDLGARLVFDRENKDPKKKYVPNPENWEIVREVKRRSGRIDLKTHDVKCTKCDYIDKDPDSEKENCPACLEKDNLKVPLIRHTPGPYTMKFRKEYLEQLLLGQIKIQKQKNDPDMELILKEEIDEIQRIWRMEQGDWQNSVYQMYEKITGIKLEPPEEDLGGFGDMEEKLLQQVCVEHNVPTQLVSTLLNEEFKNQGVTRHSKIFKKIVTHLSKEWGDDVNEIIKTLQTERREFDAVAPAKRQLLCGECKVQMLFDNKKKLYHCTECELNILNGKINDAIRTGKALRKKSNASN
jgi:DNA sulfur modification protein DndC